jgi:hypothetical protein
MSSVSDRTAANGARFRPGMPAGHYESWFQRANHPTKPQGFWIRYTIFAPKHRPADAQGELWAIWFDGETGEITAVKQDIPVEDCRFAARGIDVVIADSTLGPDALRGAAASGHDRIRWDLAYTSPTDPLLLLPEAYYDRGFPKAKALVGSPNAVYTGSVEVNGVTQSIDGWVGSQNHNWGSKHTDAYAWCQVAGFDQAPGSFLELSTARVRLGPVWTPWMTLMVLRHGGKEYRLNGMLGAVRAQGRYEPFHWTFSAQDGPVSISGTVSALAEHFVGLPYRNPPGGVKTCLNCKIARCALTLRVAGQPPVSLVSQNRAAFEILTDDNGHGVPVLATVPS